MKLINANNRTHIILNIFECDKEKILENENRSRKKNCVFRNEL